MLCQHARQKANESAYEPDSVPFRAAIIHLDHPLLSSLKQLPSDWAGSLITSDNLRLKGGGSCLAPGGVYLVACVTTNAGALLPHPFTLTPALRQWRFALCCTFPRIAPGCR